MPDTRTDLVVVGASAGGVEALSALVGHLPADLPAPVLVVLHLPAYARSVLPEILARAGALPATQARDGERLEAGHVYVAPPNLHLLVDGDRVRLTNGAAENGHRPAVDPLFRSAAASHGARAAGVVLSGALDDGTAGLAAIGDVGGATLVQDPAEAAYPSMPESALAFANPEFVLPIAELAHALIHLTSDPRVARPPRQEVDLVTEQAPNPAGEHAQPGDIAPFVCPECGGNLWEAEQNGVLSYRCRVGHAYSLEALDAENGGALERALWTAYRALEERAAMSYRVARRLADRGRQDSAARFERQAEAAARQAQDLQGVLAALGAGVVGQA